MKKSVKNIKLNVIIGTGALFVLLMGIFIYINQLSYKSELNKEVEKLKTTLEKTYNYEVQSLETFYKTRVKCNVRDKKLLEYFENKDTKKLYSVVKDKYTALTSENRFLKVMHFASKDNITILRAHNPKKHSDDLSSFRPIVKNANSYLKSYFGLETGKHGLFFRTVSPVFNKKREHIGSLEFGVDLDYMIDKLNQYYPLNRYAFLVDKEQLKSYSKKTEAILYNDSYILSDNNNFFRQVYNEIDLSEEYTVVQKNDKKYLVMKGISVKNYLNENIGSMLVAFDITKIDTIFENNKNNILIFGSMFLLLAIFLLNIGLSRYVKKLEYTTLKLEGKLEEIEKDNELLEKYTISSKTDLKGNIIHVSDAFCEISGYSKEELIGKSHNIVRHPDMSKDIYTQMWSLLKAGQYWEGEVKNMKKDGSYYWVKAYITPEFDRNGNTIGYSAVRKDITLKKDLE